MPVGKLNQDKTREKVAQERSEEDKNTFFQFKDGKNLIRVIPPPPDSEDVFYKVATHWNVGPNGKTFNCPAAQDKTVNCFLCATSKELCDSDDEDDQALGDAIRPKKQWLYNIVDVKNPEAGIQVVAVGITIHEKLRAYLEDDEGEYGDITDLEEGYNITVEKKGKGQQTKYPTVEARRKPSAVDPSIVELLETEDPADLSKARPVATNAAMKAAFEGEEDDDDDDDDDDDTPTVRKKAAAKKADKKKSAKKAKPADDDDDGDDEDHAEDDDAGDADDDDGDDEKPKRTIGSRLSSRRR